MKFVNTILLLMVISTCAIITISAKATKPPPMDDEESGDGAAAESNAAVAETGGDDSLEDGAVAGETAEMEENDEGGDTPTTPAKTTAPVANTPKDTAAMKSSKPTAEKGAGTKNSVAPAKEQLKNDNDGDDAGNT